MYEKEMKKSRYLEIWSAVVCSCMLFCFLLFGEKDTVQAAQVIPEYTEWSYTLDNSTNQMIITQWNYKYSSITDILVPATYTINGVVYNVKLDGAVFSSERGSLIYNKIQKVAFEPGVSVGSCAGMFQECRDLISVPPIPEGVTDCSNMFNGCTSLVNVPEIPSSVINCAGMFAGTSLTSAPKIPEGATDCSAMFTGCKGLTIAPEIPSSVTNCAGMFGGTSLTSAPKIPEGVTDCSGMFGSCTGLTTAPEIPAQVTKCIGMFSGCTGLTVAPKIPEGVTECYNMFSGCTGLINAPEIPKNVKICNFMFDGCTSLTSAPKIPDGVTTCFYMFENCTSLETAPYIPASVTGCWAMFKGCTSLKTAPDILSHSAYCPEMFSGCRSLSGKMTINEPLDKDILGCYEMFKDAATEGTGLTIYYADGVNIDKILASKSANSKITAKSLSGSPTPTPVNPTPTPVNPTPTPVNPTPSLPAGTKVATYNGDTFYQGSDGNLRCYDKNNQLVTNEFKCDGTYTYYMQADGTPMKDRLTYHPDGEHIIYLDTEGHEVFTNFQYCPSVGYICYFDSQGYLYKDQITFVGDKTYYLNGNGAMEQSGWFQFANGLDYGYANGDGTLVTTGFSCDPYGRTVFYHWNGMVARGLISDGVYYYNMDTTDGHYLGQFPVQ